MTEISNKCPKKSSHLKSARYIIVSDVRVTVLTSVAMKISISWKRMLHSMMKVSPCFEGTDLCLLVSCLVWSSTLNMSGDMFLQNVADLHWTTRHYVPQDRTHHDIILSSSNCITLLLIRQQVQHTLHTSESVFDLTIIFTNL